MAERTAGTIMPAWARAAVAILGVFLMAGPTAVRYGDARLAASDLAAGLLLALLAAAPPRGWVRWAIACVGVWLTLAPLVFWAREPAVYHWDTLIGALAIAFSVLLPVEERPELGPETVPAGWDYDPSTWAQRAPVIALGFAGFFLARPMASFQLGHIDAVWDPFFGAGTERVLRSDVSRAWPVSDAGLGAATYLLETLTGFIGGERRWRTMPWMVLLFGVLVVPAGAVSIVLIILQPVAVGDWCSWCLATAFTTLITIPPALDEVVAMGQYLRESRRQGRPFWRTFWRGGETVGVPAQPRAADETGLLGLSAPWTVTLSALLGLWVAASPALLGMRGDLAGGYFVAGPLIVTFAVIAMAEVARPARLLNLAMALGVALAGFWLDGGSTAARLNGLLSGALLGALSLPRGRLRHRYGGWNALIV